MVSAGTPTSSLVPTRLTCAATCLSGGLEQHRPGTTRPYFAGRLGLDQSPHITPGPDTPDPSTSACLSGGLEQHRPRYFFHVHGPTWLAALVSAGTLTSSLVPTRLTCAATCLSGGLELRRSPVRTLTSNSALTRVHYTHDRTRTSTCASHCLAVLVVLRSAYPFTALRGRRQHHRPEPRALTRPRHV